MPIELKRFQTETLAALAAYLEAVRLSGDPQDAFLKHAARDPSGRIPTYRRAPGLERVPYVCLRVPTGGGKTILGAHAIRVAARTYIEKDYPVVLWLVPTNTIRKQTAAALKDAAHPYRQALDDAFDGRVAVFDIADLDHIRPADLSDRVCVVVGTIQTLRVEETEGRDVYAHKEALEDHFARLSHDLPGLERFTDAAHAGSPHAGSLHAGSPHAGQVKYSFANLMMLHQPLVIVDEAHNARTGLTFSTLQRLAPACIIELTATPDTSPRTGSNILYRVSASQLKADELIKLPITLVEHTAGWQEAVTDALLTRARLAELAPGEAPDYIRPLVLIQAENRDRPANVTAVKQYLIEKEHVAPEKIAVATGEQRELDDINLFDPACQIEVIITVQALKEEWDCSFAYVFCSTANISSSKDVEQLLGRVLRMPYARTRRAPELNKAYAHVASSQLARAANELKDALVERMGFEETEAQQAIEQGERRQQQPLFDDLPLFETAAEPEARAEAPKTPTSFAVPRLCVWLQGELELAEPELFLDAAGWSLLDCSAELPDFQFNESSRTWEFDLAGSRVVYHYQGAQQLALPQALDGWTVSGLVRWLDRELQQPDITQVVLQGWLLRAVKYLLDRQRFDLPTLVRARFILLRALGEKIRACRATAFARGYTESLFGPSAAVATSFDYEFRFDVQNYPARYYCDSSYRWRNHLGGLPPGELDARGEEFDCAQALDLLAGVKVWARNLAGPGRQDSSFSLPTPADRFYPDFVALLEDGRLLVVEYKGDPYATNQDTAEKLQVGELWELRSNGQGLFLLAEKRDAAGRTVYEQLQAKITRST